MFKRTTFVFVSFILVFADFAVAETIHLKDGSVIKGNIISSDDQNININTDLGKLTISKEKVLSIDYVDKEKTEEKNQRVNATDNLDSKLKEIKDVINRVENVAELSKITLDDRVLIKYAYNKLNLIRINNPESPEVYYLLAKCYLYNRRTQNAVEALKTALVLKPDYIEAMIFKGDVKIKLATSVGLYGNEDIITNSSRLYEEADIEYKKVLFFPNINKENESLVYYKLGNLSSTMGNQSKALEYWKKAIEIAPESQAAKWAEFKINKK